MDYLFLIIAAMLYSLMFLTNRGYQRSNGTGLGTALTFSMYTSATALAIFLVLTLIGKISSWSVLSGFNLNFTPFSLLMASMASLVVIGYSIFSIKALGAVNLSLYSIFAMLGGMLLPSLYGLIFSGEELTWGKIACYLMIAIALILTFEKGQKSNKKSLIYCFGVFILNGLSGVVTSIHREPGFAHMAVSSEDFTMMNRAISVVLCLIAFLMIYKKFPKLKLHDVKNVSGNAVCGGMGNLLQLIALVSLPSSVLFPIITGGTMLFSMIVSFIIKEKPSAKTIVASVIAAASTVLMMF